MSKYQQVLLTSAALLLCAGGALAQTAASNAAGQLEQVVVTATRQADTVNRVPLSITAETQRSLDQRGVKVLGDLIGTAPALAITGQSNPSVANISIRGISDQGLGSATTGFYLDDIPLQKRNAGGAFTGNGTPLPPLFDLDRVEVLRGPQGTLFGGSSEGGTVRYITPTPSLTHYSTYARAEASTTEYGDPSYEAGVAVGGPIVNDKLGFRASYYDHHTGGYIDSVNRLTAQPQFTNMNSGDTAVFRGALLWAPTDRARITFAYLQSYDHYNSAPNSYSPSLNGPIVSNPTCFNTSAATPLKPVLNFNATPCPATAIPGQTVNGIFERPGATYGPYPQLGPGQTIFNYVPQPSTSNIFIPSLNIEYDFPGFTFKSITSHVYDEEKTVSANAFSQIRDSNGNYSYNGLTIGRGFTSLQAVPLANFQNEVINTNNASRGWTEEIRLSSTADARPFSWVAGAFYSDKRNNQQYAYQYPGFNAIAEALYGITGAQRYGAAFFQADGSPSAPNFSQQTLRDIEMAGFAEANYWILPKLRATAGIRVERVESKYASYNYGPVLGISQAASLTGLGRNNGKFDGTPVTPKFELEYQFTPDDMTYIEASKGFRPGGVNNANSTSICTPGFAQFGLPVSIPTTYNSDSVWNYELGGKFRALNNRVQINGDVYEIDWTSPQLAINVGLGCPAFVGNAGKARSRGLELEAQAKLFGGLTGNVAVGYTDARYTQNAIFSSAGTSPIYAAFKDQKIPVPPVTFQIGLRYDFEVMGKATYIRGDYRYVAHYNDTPTQDYTFGGIANLNFSPDNVYQDSSRLNLRAGVDMGGFDFNVFVNNVFNNENGITTGGRGSCATPAAGGTAACNTFVTYQPYYQTQPANMPRQIGVQIVYRQ